MDPPLRVEREARVHREAGRQGEPGGLRLGAEHLEVRPRALGVHVVGGHGRDAAPVVDAGREERTELVAEVGRRLDRDLGREDQACERHRFEVLVGRAGGSLVHRGAGLRQEVLDDDLLHVPPPLVGGGDRLEGLDPVVAGLADPHEDPAGERDPQLARSLEGGEAPLRRLVGGAPVGVEVVAQRLDHHPLRRRHRPQQLQLLGEQRPGVRVGEQAGLVEHHPGHGRQVLHRGSVAVLLQPLGRSRVAQLRPLTEGEQGLVAARASAGAGDGEHLLGGEVGLFEAGGRLGERAVAAAVPAQLRERDEDLG